MKTDNQFLSFFFFFLSFSLSLSLSLSLVLEKIEKILTGTLLASCFDNNPG